MPNVSTITTPLRSWPAPNVISATPAASASLSTATSQPVAAVKSVSASTPIHDSSMFAALCTTPWRTTVGIAAPIGPVHSKCSTSSFTMGAIASGVAGCGVSTWYRSSHNSPVSRATGAAFMPEPPMSMPSRTTPALPVVTSVTVPSDAPLLRRRPGCGVATGRRAPVPGRRHASPARRHLGSRSRGGCPSPAA